jgi:hypothetical protein
MVRDRVMGFKYSLRNASDESKNQFKRVLKILQAFVFDV